MIIYYYILLYMIIYDNIILYYMNLGWVTDWVMTLSYINSHLGMGAGVAMAHKRL